MAQSQTHTFPSEISRLSRLLKMSLYLFLLSGTGGNPGGVWSVTHKHTKASLHRTWAGCLEGGETDRKRRESKGCGFVGSA